MPRAPSPRSRRMVIAIGIRTVYWDLLVRNYPFIHNCCIDVREAFNKEWDETNEGTGFHRHVRDRIKRKPTWRVVWEIAIHILDLFGILLVVCNHGKHRSLTVGYEVAQDRGCELISPRDRHHQVDLSNPQHFLSYVAPRIKVHWESFGKRPHPLVMIGVCTRAFNGPEWARTRYSCDVLNPQDLHVIEYEGEVMVELDKTEGDGSGWAFGTLIRNGDVIRRRWYPPKAVACMRNWHFPEVRDLTGSLKMHWDKYIKRLEAPWSPQPEPTPNAVSPQGHQTENLTPATAVATAPARVAATGWDEAHTSSAKYSTWSRTSHTSWSHPESQASAKINFIN